MRKFELENGLGQKYQLTNKNIKTFLNQPNGLGTSQTLESIRLGNVQKVTSSIYSTPVINGEMLFYNKGSQYQDYFDFVKFISYKPIKLFYTPSNSIEPYYIECELSLLEKSEISYEDSVMHCPITLLGTTMWRKANETQLVLTNQEVGKGKYYDLERPYAYAGTTLENIEIYNNGTLPNGFKVEIVGDVQNPQITAFDENGDKYGVIKLLGTYDYVRVNTNDEEQEIYLENEGSVIANPTSYQDLSIADGVAVMTFFKFKVGKTNLVFTSGNVDTFDGQVIFTWSNEFMSV